MEFISKELSEYIRLNSDEEPKLLQRLSEETHQKTIHPRMLSGHMVGRFLSLISKLIRPKKILEIGTFTGYSALCLAEGLDKEGILHTIDENEELIEFQKKYFDKSPYKNKIIQHLGKAKSLVKKMDGNFDLIFIDADKTNYLNYYKTLVPKLNKNGLIIADNVLWSGKVLDKENDDPDTIALKKFNQSVKEDKRVDTIILEIRDGLTLCRKI
tara:strand:- start:550 stop:1188 length:639 start_codon:yes stop_codon:yes gene_type:complete